MTLSLLSHHVSLSYVLWCYGSLGHQRTITIGLGIACALAADMYVQRLELEIETRQGNDIIFIQALFWLTCTRSSSSVFGVHPSWNSLDSHPGMEWNRIVEWNRIMEWNGMEQYHGMEQHHGMEHGMVLESAWNGTWRKVRKERMRLASACKTSACSSEGVWLSRRCPNTHPERLSIILCGCLDLHRVRGCGHY